jgi:biopolymer transport protein ExbB
LFEIVTAGGVVMVPLLLLSVLTVAIVLERFWTLQPGRVSPSGLTSEIWSLIREQRLTPERLAELERASALGRILAAGLSPQAMESRERMRERIEDIGRHVVHDLGRYLNTLGTVAAISPLLGLLGTVTGMIRIFAAVEGGGMGDARVLSGGIAEALITTAAGLLVAIPALLFYRYFRSRIDALVVRMEQETIKLMDALHDAGLVGGSR